MKKRQSEKQPAPCASLRFAPLFCSHSHFAVPANAPAPQDLRPLWAPGQHLILHLASGQLLLQPSAPSGNTPNFSLPPGALLLLSSQDHATYALLAGPSTSCTLLQFPGEALLSSIPGPDRIEYLRPFLGPSPWPPHHLPASQPELCEILAWIERLGQLSTHPGPHSDLAAKTFLQMILLLLRPLLLPSPAAPPALPPQDLHRLQPLLHYLAHHYMESISVERAAQLLNMSKSHFMRFFRRTTGSAFVPYLNHFRISKAQALMAQSPLSIAEVAESVGLCDQSYFSKVFRRINGIGPREYRNQCRSA